MFLLFLFLLGRQEIFFGERDMLGGGAQKMEDRGKVIRKVHFQTGKGQQLLTRALLHAESNRLCRIRRVTGFVAFGE